MNARRNRASLTAGLLVLCLLTACSSQQQPNTTATTLTTPTAPTEMSKTEPAPGPESAPGPTARAEGHKVVPKDGVFLEDGALKEYREGDLYWDWPVEGGLSEGAAVFELNALMEYYAIQDENRVILINGRDSEAEVLAENGLITRYWDGDCQSTGCLWIDEGSLYFKRLYPFNVNGEKVVLITEGVNEVIGSRGFQKDGVYFFIDNPTWEWEEEGVEFVFSPLGDHHIIKRDLQRLEDGKMTLDEFALKYEVSVRR